MKRYILFLLTLLAFSSCGEDEISMLSAPCNQDLVCTEELRYLSYKAMLDGRNKYTTTAGLPKLRQVIAES